MAEARINREYLLRMCGVAAFLMVICVWSLYDGYVAWPRKNQDFDRVRPALQGTNLTVQAWLAKSGEYGETPLDAVFSKENLKTPTKLVREIDEYRMSESLPMEQLSEGREREKRALEHIFSNPLYSPSDLQGQLVMAVMMALGAGWILLTVIPKISKVYVADENGLKGSGFGKDVLNYADIDSVDWKLWDKKSIVKLVFKCGTSYTLDGWHFKGIKDIVNTIVENRPDLK